MDDQQEENGRIGRIISGWYLCKANWAFLSCLGALFKRSDLTKRDCRSHFDSMSEMRKKRTEKDRVGGNLLKGKDIEQTESGSVFPEREEKALCIVCGS